MPQLEQRAASSALQADDAGVIEGYAATWGKPDGHGDTWMPGAFAATLASHRAAGTMPLMLWSHDPSRPVGVWQSMQEDATGLHVRGQLVMDSTAGRDAFALAKAGAITGLSVGFRTRRSTPKPSGGRHVHQVDLAEVSLVTMPSQSAARVTSTRAISTLADLVSTIRECTRGFSRKG